MVWKKIGGKNSLFVEILYKLAMVCHIRRFLISHWRYLVFKVILNISQKRETLNLFYTNIAGDNYLSINNNIVHETWVVTFDYINIDNNAMSAVVVYMLILPLAIYKDLVFDYYYNGTRFFFPQLPIFSIWLISNTGTLVVSKLQ